MLALLILLELTGRLSLIAALLAVPRSSQIAAAIAGAAALASVLRALLKGAVVARETERAWREVAVGIQHTELATLLARRADAQHVSMLVDSVREVSSFRATAISELAADAVALSAVVVFGVVTLPLYWAAAIGAGLVAAAVWMRASRRAQRRVQQIAFEEFARVARDAEALVEAGLELRAHAAERAHLDRMLSSVARMADAERRSYRLSAASAALPSALALGLVLTPKDLLHELAQQVGWMDLGVVGATGLGLAVAVARGVDGVARSSVHRALFDRVTREGTTPRPPAPDHGALERVAFVGVSVVRAGASLATPARLTFELASGGVVLAGENGVGKTSAILALLGFLSPTEGGVVANGVRLGAADFEWLRSRVAFLPQRSFVAPSETLAFHAGLAGVTELDALVHACDRVGLGAVLGRAGFESPMGSLSGGERQRFLIARALARRADLLVLDEPEAGLDASQREKLRAILAEEARERRVLLVAHDENVIPEGFTRIQCSNAGIPAEGGEVPPL
ncbi:MAG: ABC transporter ATP-binding protein/permease [Polyangiaceae bacterium]